MGSHKPRSAVDSLPDDYENPRGAGSRREIADPLTTTDGSLVIAHLSPEERAERNAAAVRYLRRRGAEDLIEVLGLGAEAPAVMVSAPPSSVPCPQCAGRIGEPCISAKSGLPWNGYHTSRRRKANQVAEEKGAAA